MIVGIIIGLIVSLLVWLVAYAIKIDCCFSTEKIINRISIVVCVMCVVLGGVIGISVANINLKQDIEGFSAIKETYMMAVSNNEISGLERLQIVDTAIDQNKRLARRKASIDAWWNIAIDPNLKDQLKELTPINS